MTKTFRHRNLPLLLLQAREGVIAHFRPILNHFGLTEQQWRVIRALSEAGEMEPWQICAVCQILKPSLTGVLGRMEELGLVKRRPHETDQRRMLVSLTAKSRALVERMIPLIEAQYRELEQAIGADLVAALYRALDRLLDQLQTPAPLIELPAGPARPVRVRRVRAARRAEARRSAANE